MLILALFWIGVILLFSIVVFAGAVGLIVLIFIGFGLVFGVLIFEIGIVTELVTISQILDDLAGKFCKFRLIGQNLFDRAETAAGLPFNKITPKIHHIGSIRRQVPPGGEMTHEIAGGRCQRCLAGFANIAKALTQRFILNLCINIGMGAGHGAGTNRFAARRFHRFIDVAGHLPLRDIAVECACVVEFMAQGQSVSGATGQTHLLRTQPPADLWQADGVAGRARRIHRIGHRQFGIIGHNLGGFGQCLFERIGRIVVILHQYDPLGARSIGAYDRLADTADSGNSSSKQRW